MSIEKKYLIKASEFYLCNSPELSIEQQLDILINDKDNSQCLSGVVYCEPFENYLSGALLKLIHKLAFTIKSLCEKAYIMGGKSAQNLKDKYDFENFEL